ncbi:hypothetical protein LguiB_022511 [Lonicera macranthoides]
MEIVEEKKVNAEKCNVDLLSTSDQSRPNRSFSKPSWLLLTIAELDERMKMVDSNTADGENNSDTFAGRAESYYRKRPQLLSLLHDLYNAYLSLADRYCQTLPKHHRSPSSIPPLRTDSDEDSGAILDIGSDAESSLSYQLPTLTTTLPKLDADTIVEELVIKTVDYEILVDEIGAVDRRHGDSLRKIELQRSLLEVLESERLILLSENARLGYRVAALVEENRGLSSESLFMKRKAGELARCVLKMREDQRVLMMNRKIEDLQGQIYGLEKRNKEYYQQLVKQEEVKKSKNGGAVTLEDCFHVEEELEGGTVADVVLKGGRRAKYGGGGGGRRRGLKLWDRVKKFDVLMCGAWGNDLDSSG